ncbi:MAG: YicC/YloC family endoribonuclease [Bacteroidales bacterium]|nr:YicC family protein [Bacteroidales bacterium]MDY6075887.1 YicC/YloC family endoribonuclease [Bacteroidales bacterium]
MIRSMTGYGKAEQLYNTNVITVEIKTLNSKQLDLSLRTPQELKPYELLYRNEIASNLQRGKIDVTITITNTDVSQNTHIEKEVVASYFQQINSISKEYGIPESKDIAAVIFRMPGIFASPEQEYDEDFLTKIVETLSHAIMITNEFREKEGSILKKDLLKRVALILEYLDAVEPFENNRHEIIKGKLLKNLQELTSGEYDENRFEQELIFYLEKLDITEEKVRLLKHCDYFYETIDEENAGKKLGFIAQEMGREINTLGSKANDADIQRLVVKMKDELEKIKEQLFNIL